MIQLAGDAGDMAVSALAYRDRLLHAVTVSTGMLVKAKSLRLGMPGALRVMGEALGVDRILLIRQPATPDGPPILTAAWQAPNMPSSFDLSSFTAGSPDMEALGEWRARMRDGNPLVAQLAASDGAIREMMEKYGNKSTLIVPIFVDEALWGGLAADSCVAAHDWKASEIDIMRTFGDIAGSMVAHDETRHSLARSQTRLQRLMATSPDAIISADAAGLIQHWNKATERMLGYAEAEALGKRVYDLVLPADHPEQEPAIMAGAMDPIGKTIEIIVVRKNGTRLAVELSISGAQVDGQRESIGILRDITARKAEQAAIGLLASIVNSSEDAIVGLSKTGIITSWNPGAERLHFYHADEVIGKPASMLVPEARRASILGHFPVLARGETVKPFDAVGLRKDGTRVDISVTASAIHDLAGAAVGVAFIARDITASKAVTAALAYRDRLLHAVMVGTGALITAECLAPEMPRALRIIGEALGVDRVFIMQHHPDAMPPFVVRHKWQGPDIDVGPDFPRAMSTPDILADLESWRAPVREGKPAIAQLAASTGAQRALLRYFHNQSMLAMPIFVHGQVWGSLCIDACKVARAWPASETDTMKTFAGSIGSLIQRDQARLTLEKSEARLRVMTQTAQDGIITIDGSARISSWNLAASRILGYSREETIGQPVHSVLAPTRLREGAGRSMDIFLATGAGDQVGKTTELPALRKDGTEIIVELSLAGARIGDEWEATGILRDITRRKETENKVLLANIQLRTQMEASPDGILVVDASGNLISFNQRFAKASGCPAAILATGDYKTILASGAPAYKEPEKFLARVRYLDDHPSEAAYDELEMTDGRFVDRNTVSMVMPDGTIFGRVWFFRDVTEHKRAVALALRMARFDWLTGLANRSVFVAALEHAVAMARRGHNGFAVIYLDLDHFKDVNDTLGHPVGDALLQAVARRLEANTRESDTVARFGGDEFAVVVSNVADPADAMDVAQALIRVLREPFSILGNDIHSGASIGIDVFGPGSSDAETLLSHADVALYRAKAAGRGEYRFFTDAMDAEVRTRVTLGEELRKALAGDQLFLLYQPQVQASTRRIIGLEALARWNHPTRGIIGPGVFMQVAETTGIIGNLGHWVLWETCRQAKSWLDAGLPPVRVSVNVSALQFLAPLALEADILAALAHSGLPPRLLELELTETALMGVAHGHGEVLQRLRRAGVTLAIDDFGTGYSSLDYLRRFPADRIKIAQSFVRDIETMSGDVVLVKATIGLARELGIAVIAEGVETRAQLDLLTLWGCDEIQGFYFSRPVAADAITEMLRRGGFTDAAQPKRP